MCQNSVPPVDLVSDFSHGFVFLTAASVDVVDAPPRSSIMSWKTKDVLEWLNAVHLKDW